MRSTTIEDLRQYKENHEKGRQFISAIKSDCIAKWVDAEGKPLQWVVDEKAKQCIPEKWRKKMHDKYPWWDVIRTERRDDKNQCMYMLQVSHLSGEIQAGCLIVVERSEDAANQIAWMIEYDLYPATFV